MRPTFYLTHPSSFDTPLASSITHLPPCGHLTPMTSVLGTLCDSTRLFLVTDIHRKGSANALVSQFTEAPSLPTTAFRPVIASGSTFGNLAASMLWSPLPDFLPPALLIILL